MCPQKPICCNDHGLCEHLCHGEDMPSKIQLSPTGAYDNPQFSTIDENSNETTGGGHRRRQSSLLRFLFASKDRRESAVSNDEVLPQIEYYRSITTLSRKAKRPEIDELHLPHNSLAQTNSHELGNSESDDGGGSTKLGWVDGVYIRTMMNLFGVMLFLRMGWMAGQAGILLALTQILIATTITIVTTLSMIALCTNGNIGGGGIYAMISRSVGHEAGGVIGFLFTFTNAAFVGLNLLGTAESVTDIFKVFDISICGSAVNDQRIVGYICLIIIAIIPLISLEFEAKTLMFFFFTLIISLIDYFVGAILSPTEIQQAKGMASWKSYVIADNLYPRWDGYDFFQVFGVFFPSVTGIFTGASMSADLKDPATAIPKGTFLAIGTTSLTYSIIILFTGSTIVAYSSGNINDTLVNSRHCQYDHCPYGLINDYQTMSMSGGLAHTSLKVDPLIYAGIFAATLSSGLGCYTAAPRIFKAFADDNLIPFISWFGKGYGPSKSDPRHGYVITFIIAAIFIAIDDVNVAGVWIANFYLGAFFMVNFSLFYVAWVSSLSFRPSFKFYNKWLSLLIGLLCIVLMFLFDPISGVTVCALTVFIYISMLFVNPVKANWGPSTEEQFFNIARHLTFRLNVQDEHVKHYRPMILLLSGNPTNRTALVDMANHMTKKYGFLIMAHIAQGPINLRIKDEIVSKQKQWLRNESINAFYKLIEADSVSGGAKSCIQAAGIGKFTPNIVMFGYKTNWQSCDSTSLSDYYQIIHSVLDNNLSIIIFRLREGHDSTAYIESFKLLDSAYNTHTEKNSEINSIKNETPDSQQNSINDFNDLANFSPNLNELANRFKTKQTKGTIDVWWIYDDGGLTLLVPFILKNNSLWRGSKLRVFSVTKSKFEINTVQDSLKQLLNKFRIPYTAVQVLSDSDQLPSEDTKNNFIKLMSKSMSTSDEQTESLKNELTMFKNKTNRYLRLREHLDENSRKSTLVVMTLPIPRKQVVSATLYMSWIETLTRDMPPFLLIRGNQSNVLTFYC